MPYLMPAMQCMQVLAGADDDLGDALHWIVVLHTNTKTICVWVRLCTSACVYCVNLQCCSKAGFVIDGCIGCGCSFLRCAFASAGGSITTACERMCCTGKGCGWGCSLHCSLYDAFWLCHCIRPDWNQPFWGSMVSTDPLMSS